MSKLNNYLKNRLKKFKNRLKQKYKNLSDKEILKKFKNKKKKNYKTKLIKMMITVIVIIILVFEIASA